MTEMQSPQAAHGQTVMRVGRYGSEAEAGPVDTYTLPDRNPGPLGSVFLGISAFSMPAGVCTVTAPATVRS